MLLVASCLAQIHRVAESMSWLLMDESAIHSKL